MVAEADPISSAQAQSSIAHELRQAAALLESVSDTPRLDAELLAAHALDMERMTMLGQIHNLSAPAEFARMIERRLAHEPVAYITGKQAFWDIELDVTPDVLIPRSDSETLINIAEQYHELDNGPKNILDLGTGSGALILAALSLFPDAHGLAIDASEAALKVAVGNAQKLKMSERLEFKHLSWKDENWIRSLGGPFDLILCNPPYIEIGANLDPNVAQYEPGSALYSGDTGLDDYRVILPQIPALLSQDGIALFEIGSTQARNVANIAADSGLSSVLYRDLAGLPRCLKMRRNAVQKS